MFELHFFHTRVIFSNQQEKIAQSARNAEYNPKRFQAVIMRIREPRTTALIFRTGKMIITGAKRQRDLENGSDKYVAILQKLGNPCLKRDFTIQNVTATCDVGFPIRLESFYNEMKDCASSMGPDAEQSITYEPEIFPGLVYRMRVPKVVLLVFVSGKLVLTGARCQENLGDAMGNIYEKLLPHKKANVITMKR